MASTLLGLFDDPLRARRAMDALRSSGVKLDDLSLIAPASQSAEHHGDVSPGEGATVGAVWGGLVGMAALLIPGVGPFIALGALGAALTGALTGAAVGGIAAALIHFSDLPAEDAREYEQRVQAGQTLVAVKVREDDALEVRRILASAGAESIRDNQTDITHAGASAVHVAMYDGSGRRVNEADEYGAPTNPATVQRGSAGAMPLIEPGANLSSPVVTEQAADAITDEAGSVSLDKARQRGDTAVEKVVTPEALGHTNGAPAADTKKPATRSS